MNDPGLEDGIQGVEDGATKPPQHGGYRDPQSKQHIRTRTSNKRSRQEEAWKKFYASDRESDQEEEN